MNLEEQNIQSITQRDTGLLAPEAERRGMEQIPLEPSQSKCGSANTLILIF